MTQDFAAYAMETPGEYTETLGNLIAFGYDTDDKLHLSDDYYPIYDESHRVELNEKIVRHYALREIGQETAQQFIFIWVRRWRKLCRILTSAIERLIWNIIRWNPWT